MQDPITPALQLLSERGQNDAARALARCAVVLRHVGRTDDRQPVARPMTDILIHTSDEVLGLIRHHTPPQGDWTGQIEHALRDVLAPRFAVREIQWTQTEPADLSRGEGARAAGEYSSEPFA